MNYRYQLSVKLNNKIILQSTHNVLSADLTNLQHLTEY